MKKSILKATLAVAMTLGLVAPAFAADTVVESATDGIYKADMPITSTIKTPTIKITVPEKGAVVLNPYSMEATINGATSTAGIQYTNQFIKNESDVRVSISMTATGKIADPSKAVFIATPPTAATTTKAVYTYAQLGASTDGTAVTWGSFNAKDSLVIGTKAATLKDAYTMEPGSINATYAAFHLAGTAAPTPALAWGADDTVEVAMAFTFAPALGK